VAIYVPRARRRRNLIADSVICAVVGVALGLGIGRASAPTVEDRVGSVRTSARDIAAQLRVVSLHISSGAQSLEDSNGDAGAELALRRTESDLRKLVKRAPWVPSKAATDLLADTVALRAEAPHQARSVDFGKQVDALAARIESTFGATA
jgi:hypothetical protein